MLVLSDRASESNVLPASLSQVTQLVDRRLAIARKGLAAAREYLAAGQAEDATIVLEKIDEDLHLLCRRLGRETKVAARRPRVLCGRADHLSESN